MRLTQVTLILTLSAVLTSSALWANTVTYPGAAPCDTTLQACIDGAGSGDTIEIATNTRISENLTISKSLTLTSAAGSSALIGNANPATPNSMNVEDTGGSSVAVTFDGINFDAAYIQVDLFNHAGDSFSMTNCHLTFSDGNNNSDGIGTSISVPSTVLLQNNTLATTGQPIDIATFQPSGDITLTVQSNILTTSDPSNSEEGLQIRPAGSGGTVTVNVFDNVIYGVAGCNCGANNGIDVEPNNGAAADVTVNLINNTLDDIQMNGNGIYVRQTGAGHLTTNIFNNIITNATGPAIQLPVLSANLIVNNGSNDIFNSLVSDFGGYAEGSGDLGVDPHYADAASFNYHLTPGSPLIDAGTSAPTGGLPSTDFDGRARVVGAHPDMGAFEASSDLSVTKVGDIDPFALATGGNLTYTMVVTNNGPYDTDQVTLLDTLPTGETFVSAAFGGTDCSEASGVVTCALGAMANGTQQTVSLVVTPTASGTVENTATVSGSVPDPDVSNNTATASTTVHPVPSSGGCSLVR